MARSKSWFADSKHALSNYTLIDKGSVIEGNIRASGLMRVEGTVKGVIRSEGEVVVGPQGCVIGDVYALVVRIGGKIQGDVYALEKADLLASGVLMGALYATRFLADEGGSFTGKSSVRAKESMLALFEKAVYTISAETTTTASINNGPPGKNT